MPTDTPNTVSVPFEIIDPHALYMRESIATGELNGYSLEFDGAGNIFLLRLKKDDSVIKATISVAVLIENFANAVIAANE